MDRFGGEIDTPEKRRAYLNFYGNLMKASDGYLVDVLGALEANGLMDDTLVVRTSDHGEMGLTHGGMRQKNFNFYEETLRVPMVYSNPKLYPKPHTSDALVSHVDLLPTMANLVAAPKSARANWEGVDYSKLVLRPTPERSTQDYVVFTYDDYQSGQRSRRTRNRRTTSSASARSAGSWPSTTTPTRSGKGASRRSGRCTTSNATRSSASTSRGGYERTPLEERNYRRLRRKLAKVQKTRLKPRRNTA